MLEGAGLQSVGGAPLKTHACPERASLHRRPSSAAAAASGRGLCQRKSAATRCCGKRSGRPRPLLLFRRKGKGASCEVTAAGEKKGRVGRKNKLSFSVSFQLTSSFCLPAASKKRRQEPGPTPAGPRRSLPHARSEQRGREEKKTRERETKRKKKKKKKQGQRRRRRRRRRISPLLPEDEGEQGEPLPRSRFCLFLLRSLPLKPKQKRSALGPSLESSWFFFLKVRF